MMDQIQIAVLILMLASLLPLAICLLKIYLLKKYKAKAVITSAFIAASEKRRSMKNSTYYLLDISYKAIDTGIQYSAQTISGKKYATGDTMPLMYLQDDPENFKTDFGQALKWLLPISIIIIGLIGWLCNWLLNLEYTYRPTS